MEGLKHIKIYTDIWIQNHLPYLGINHFLNIYQVIVLKTESEQWVWIILVSEFIKKIKNPNAHHYDIYTKTYLWSTMSGYCQTENRIKYTLGSYGTVVVKIKKWRQKLVEIAREYTVS